MELTKKKAIDRQQKVPQKEHHHHQNSQILLVSIYFLYLTELSGLGSISKDLSLNLKPSVEVDGTVSKSTGWGWGPRWRSR